MAGIFQISSKNAFLTSKSAKILFNNDIIFNLKFGHSEKATKIWNVKSCGRLF